MPGISLDDALRRTKARSLLARDLSHQARSNEGRPEGSANAILDALIDRAREIDNS